MIETIYSISLFFLEISLGLVLINHISILQPYSITIILCIIVYKILLEYYMHVYKPKHKKMFDVKKNDL